VRIAARHYREGLLCDGDAPGRRDAAADRIIFKGGTSLLKGWGLIERFSEDIDLFLDPQSFEPPLGKNGIDRELKKLRDAVGAHPALEFARGESQTIAGSGEAIAIPTGNSSADPAKSPRGFCLNPGPPAGGSPPWSWRSSPTLRAS